ncbi:MAG: hypothetical protein K2K64_05065 [Muribaculaceae bacterium]|nr:hypothetical protein [Muribaculaceae bacterium]
MKKVLIISTSLRGNSNSHRLAEEGVTSPGEIKDHPSLKAAYDMGRSI